MKPDQLIVKYYSSVLHVLNVNLMLFKSCLKVT